MTEPIKQPESIALALATQLIKHNKTPADRERIIKQVQDEDLIAGVLHHSESTKFYLMTDNSILISQEKDSTRRFDIVDPNEFETFMLGYSLGKNK